MTTQIVAKTLEAWSAQPEKAQGHPSVLARSQGRQAVLEAGEFTWRADLPVSLGGSNQAASPTALLLSALAGCAVVFIKDTLAPQLNVQIDGVRAVASCRTDGRGLLGMDGAEAGLCDLSLELQIESPAGEEAVQRLLEVWQERCPVYLAMTERVNVRLSSHVIDPYAVG